jgi:hypothetical protein
MKYWQVFKNLDPGKNPDSLEDGKDGKGGNFEWLGENDPALGLAVCTQNAYDGEIDAKNVPGLEEVYPDDVAFLEACKKQNYLAKQSEFKGAVPKPKKPA